MLGHANTEEGHATGSETRVIVRNPGPGPLDTCTRYSTVTTHAHSSELLAV
jgi:hypothetical protein